MKKPLQILLVACLLFAGCSTREMLEPRDGTVPVGTDLSGNWLMRPVSPQDRRRLMDAINKTDGISERESARQRSSPGSANGRVPRGGLVYVFLESGTAIKVTQTPHALFVSFDRSVVEEFRFGENRLVSVGQVEAQRVTGWEGTQLVVETLGEKGMKLTERFELTSNGNTLERHITLRSQKLKEESVLQVFDRVE